MSIGWLDTSPDCQAPERQLALPIFTRLMMIDVPGTDVAKCVQFDFWNSLWDPVSLHVVQFRFVGIIGYPNILWITIILPFRINIQHKLRYILTPMVNHPQHCHKWLVPTSPHRLWSVYYWLYHGLPQFQPQFQPISWFPTHSYTTHFALPRCAFLHQVAEGLSHRQFLRRNEVVDHVNPRMLT